MAAYGIIARTEGFAGLWTGVGPNISRNALINAAELASYDQVRPGAAARKCADSSPPPSQVKQTLLQAGLADDTGTHILSVRG